MEVEEPCCEIRKLEGIDPRCWVKKKFREVTRSHLQTYEEKRMEVEEPWCEIRKLEGIGPLIGKEGVY